MIGVLVMFRYYRILIKESLFLPHTAIDNIMEIPLPKSAFDL